AELSFRGKIADQPEGQEQQKADMDTAHHLARQIVESGDVELEYRKGDANGIGEMPPDVGTKAFRKAVLKIVELDLDRRRRALGLLHRVLPLSPPAYITRPVRHGRACPGHPRLNLPP